MFHKNCQRRLDMLNAEIKRQQKEIEQFRTTISRFVHTHPDFNHDLHGIGLRAFNWVVAEESLQQWTKILEERAEAKKKRDEIETIVKDVLNNVVNKETK